jgi:hypothetical protein
MDVTLNRNGSAAWAMIVCWYAIHQEERTISDQNENAMMTQQAGCLTIDRL